VALADWETKPGIRVERLAKNSLTHTAAFIITTTLMQGVYIYIPETNHVQYGT